jgi:hypothetical protein
MRHLLFAALLLTAACNDKSAEGEKAGSAAATGAEPKKSGPAAKPEPTGPVFKAKVMGTDMSKPLVETDLGPAEMTGYVITAPEGAKVEKGRPGGGAHVVAAGVNYSIAIREGAFDAENVKKSFTALDPDGTMLEDKSDIVIFQRKGGGSVLFSMGVTVGDKKFTCGSVATAMSFDKATIDQTVASCKTLKKK